MTIPDSQATQVPSQEQSLSRTALGESITQFSLTVTKNSRASLRRLVSVRRADNRPSLETEVQEKEAQASLPTSSPGNRASIDDEEPYFLDNGGFDGGFDRGFNKDNKYEDKDEEEEEEKDKDKDLEEDEEEVEEDGEVEEEDGEDGEGGNIAGGAAPV